MLCLVYVCFVSARELCDRFLHPLEDMPRGPENDSLICKLQIWLENDGRTIVVISFIAPSAALVCARNGTLLPGI